MKNIIVSLILIMAISNNIFCQITVPKCDISIVKSDSIAWIEKYNTLIICPSTGKRESIIVGQSKSSINLGTLTFKITDSKDLLSGEVSRVYLSSRYVAFIDFDSPFSCSFCIFKKHRKSLFSKKYWKEITPPLILPPIESLLFGPYSSPNLNIINKISFVDVFSIKVYYTNGKSESFTFNPKTQTFLTKSVQESKD